MRRVICGMGMLAAVGCGGRTEEMPNEGSSQHASANREATSSVDEEAALPQPARATSPTLGPVDVLPRVEMPVDSPPVEPDAMPVADPPVDDCGYPNFPPTEGPSDVWRPYTADPAQDAFAIVAEIQSSMVGTWRGLVETPWTTPYQVEVTFKEDGQYSARCAQLPASCCVAFYYGTDEDTDIKQYRVDTLSIGGSVSGEIDVAFDYDDSYGLPAWQGLLSRLERDASSNGLRFEFQTSSGYGPLEFDLRRVADE